MPEEGKLQQLLAGEFVRVELQANLDAPHGWWLALDVLTTLLLGGAPMSNPGRSARVGTTARELVIAETHILSQPDIRRIPLDRVRVVKFSEGLLTDEIILEVGEPKSLRLALPKKEHERAQNLIALLGGLPGLASQGAAPRSLAP